MKKGLTTQMMIQPAKFATPNSQGSTEIKQQNGLEYGSVWQISLTKSVIRSFCKKNMMAIFSISPSSIGIPVGTRTLRVICPWENEDDPDPDDPGRIREILELFLIEKPI